MWPDFAARNQLSKDTSEFEQEVTERTEEGAENPEIVKAEKLKKGNAESRRGKTLKS